MTDQTPRTSVLLVDDEEEFLATTSKLLTRRGFDVRSARSGEEALASLRLERAQMVVLDLKMPGMSGDDVFEAIQTSWPGLPVIMLTGHGSISHAARMSRGGVAEYLTKPCDTDVLAERIRAAAAIRVPVSHAPQERSTPAVMIVDDEVDLLDSLRRVLGRRGMNVYVAPSGRAAIETLKVADIDVIILDIQMPGMDGFEVLREIRSSWPDRQVIVMTGAPRAESELRGMRLGGGKSLLGAMEYLSKPPDVERLVALIEEGFARRRVRLTRPDQRRQGDPATQDD